MECLGTREYTHESILLVPNEDDAHERILIHDGIVLLHPTLSICIEFMDNYAPNAKREGDK